MCSLPTDVLPPVCSPVACQHVPKRIRRAQARAVQLRCLGSFSASGSRGFSSSAGPFPRQVQKDPPRDAPAAARAGALGAASQETLDVPGAQWAACQHGAGRRSRSGCHRQCQSIAMKRLKRRRTRQRDNRCALQLPEMPRSQVDQCRRVTEIRSWA